jgi:uncharacterized protein with beta-barrel porin domain
MTNSAFACSGSTVISTSVSVLDSVSFCDLSITNTGIVNSSGGWAVSYFSGPNNTLNNAGDIRGGTYGVFIVNGAITKLNNTGTISSDPAGVGIFIGSGTVTTLSNTGTISSPTGVYNRDTITTLNNKQGAGNVSGALTYTGVLPTNYNIIIASPTSFGKLSASDVGSSTVTFNIYGNTGTTLVSGIAASTLAAGTYNSVLTGVSARNLIGSSLSGTYTGGYAWQLVNESGSTTIWNLMITGGGDSGGSAGNGSGNVPDVIQNINFTGGNSTINRGTITIGAPNYVGIGIGSSITVGPLGATMVVTSNPILFVGNLILNGPLTIVGPDGRFNSFFLGGNISGSGGLTLGNGQGEFGQTIFSIFGNNTRTGNTYVTKGALLIAGGLPRATPLGSGDIFVEGFAGLFGTFPGNVFVTGNGSALRTGGSPGYASYGSLTMGAGSTYLQDIAGKVQSDVTTITGTGGTYSFANITTGLVIESGTTLTPRLSDLFSADEPGYGSSIYIPVLGDRFRIFTAAGGITGRFTTLTQPAELSSGTQLIAFYNANGSNSLDLAIAPTSYSSTLSSSTTNAKSVAIVLDQLLGLNKAGTASAAQDSLLYAVAGQNAAKLPGFARSLSGEIHAASAATLPQTTQRVQQAVLARLGDFPMAPNQLGGGAGAGVGNTPTPLSSGAITGNNPSGLPTANMSSNPAVNPKSANITSAAVADGRAWGEIAYQRGERSGNSGGNGFNNNLYQAVFGVDAYTNAALGLKLGGGLALSNTTVNATGGNSTIQQGALFLYGKMPVAEDYVLDGMVSLGLSSTNLSRSDVTGISNGFSNKSVMGNDVLVSAGLSRPFETSGVRLTPYVRLTYQYVGQASYDEGASAAALTVSRMNANGVRGVIGVGAGSLNKDPLKDEYTYRANLAIGADSQGLLNPTLNTTLGGYSSSVTAPTAGSTFLQAGLYGTVKVADSAYAYAGVSVEARTGQTLYGGSVGLRVAF